jgi:hypothetical protein
MLGKSYVVKRPLTAHQGSGSIDLISEQDLQKYGAYNIVLVL